MGQQKLMFTSKEKQINIVCINEVPDDMLICNQNTINLIKQYIDNNYNIKKYISYE